MKLKSVNISWNKYTSTYTGTIVVGNDGANMELILASGDARTIADSVSENMLEFAGGYIDNIAKEMRA
jgi:hypothetical protein